MWKVLFALQVVEGEEKRGLGRGIKGWLGLGAGGWNEMIPVVLSSPNHAMSCEFFHDEFVGGCLQFLVCAELEGPLGEERNAAGEKCSASSSVILYSSCKYSHSFHRCFSSSCSSGDLGHPQTFYFSIHSHVPAPNVMYSILALNKCAFYPRIFQTQFSGWRFILKPCCWGSSSLGCPPTSPWTMQKTTR